MLCKNTKKQSELLFKPMQKPLHEEKATDFFAFATVLVIT